MKTYICSVAGFATVEGDNCVIICELTVKDISKAEKLVLENYEEERGVNFALPKIESVPLLKESVKSGLGAAIYDGDELQGFLYAEIQQRFDNIRAFCPVHCHGSVKKDRANLYSRLYQAAAEIWVKAGALTHEITLFSHDKEAADSFFYSVFGACVIYAVMDISGRDFVSVSAGDTDMCELPQSRYGEIIELQNGLLSHLRKSPVFLPYQMKTKEVFSGLEGKRYFAALKDGRVIAYIRIQNSAGNFVACDGGTINITGAYMYPEFRGSGIYQELLMFLCSAMKREGYSRISVDFETYNPNAMRFWTKNFTPYTTCLTRKIEPGILKTPEL